VAATGAPLATVTCTWGQYHPVIDVAVCPQQGARGCNVASANCYHSFVWQGYVKEQCNVTNDIRSIFLVDSLCNRTYLGNSYVNAVDWNKPDSDCYAGLNDTHYWAYCIDGSRFERPHNISSVPTTQHHTTYHNGVWYFCSRGEAPFISYVNNISSALPCLFIQYRGHTALLQVNGSDIVLDGAVAYSMNPAHSPFLISAGWGEYLTVIGGFGSYFVQIKLACPSGFFCPNLNISNQIPCQAGQYCPSNSSTPQVCPVGKFCLTPSSDAVSIRFMEC